MSNQEMLWDEGRSKYVTKVSRQMTRWSDPGTSFEAAASVAMTKSQKIVMIAFRSRNAMTDEELIHMIAKLGFKLSASGARSRRKELVEMGLLRDSGVRELTDNRRQTTVWELNNE